MRTSVQELDENCYETISWAMKPSIVSHTQKRLQIASKTHRCLSVRSPRWSSALPARTATRRWCGCLVTTGRDAA